MKCGKQMEDERQEYCYDCQQRTHFFREGRSVLIHQETVSKAIYDFKYHDLKCYGYAFGKEMAGLYGEYLHEHGVELLIPIPLHKKRRKERGYNQAEILAKEISRHTGIPFDSYVLKRTKSTNPQKKLDNKERMKNIKGAFTIGKKIMAENVALIDDIYTTGSTIDEAASVLRNAGVSNVYFLTISIGQGF